eukprot:jgi/Mesen1/2452/ME000158S01653
MQSLTSGTVLPATCTLASFSTSVRHKVAPVSAVSSCSPFIHPFNRSKEIHLRVGGKHNQRSRGTYRLFAINAEASINWLEKLPSKESALYSHSLPCIEAWLADLGFKQSRGSPESWRIERPDWHAELTMDVTDLIVRYLRSGPGSLPRDVERKFSYALSRQDLENAILGGP